jgi:hypothetical protein
MDFLQEIEGQVSFWLLAEKQLVLSFETGTMLCPGRFNLALHLKRFLFYIEV